MVPHWRPLSLWVVLLLQLLPLGEPSGQGNKRGLSFEFNNCDTVPQTEWDMDFEVQLAKRIHQKRLHDGLHKLFRSTFLDVLARNHSAQMQEAGSLNNDDIAKRRAQIIASGYSWFRAEELRPDPHYPPLAITTIDEMYANGTTPLHLWHDWFESYTQFIGPQTQYDHQWIGVGIVCSTNPTTGQSFYWATIILVGVCSPSSLIPPPVYSDFLCCNLPSPLNTCYLPHDAAFYYLLDESTGNVEPVCCGFNEALTPENEVPPQTSSYSGNLVMSLPIGFDQDKQLCYCLNHDIPTKDAPEVVTHGDFHYGGPGQQTESLILHSVSGDPVNHNVTECWAYEEDGLSINAMMSGKYYLELHTNNTDASAQLPPHGLIRTQVSCFGYLLDMEGIEVLQLAWNAP